jgi:iron complex transport system permease protein
MSKGFGFGGHSDILLTGALTAFTGPIAFFGIAVPHLARMLFRTSDHRLIIPAFGIDR